MRRLLICVVTYICTTVTTVQAMDGEYGEFQKLMTTPLRILAEKANSILMQKYEDNQFGGSPEIAAMLHGLPQFAMTSQSVTAAYRIADKRPDLLAGYSCYDPSCDERNYKNLLNAFLINGEARKYNNHAASCITCCSEAILIFLWSEIGASPGDITGGLRYLFDPSVHESPAITP